MGWTFRTGTWWARVAVAQASGLLLATNDGPDVWRRFVPRMLGGDAELAEYADARRGIYRAAAFAAGALTGCFFLAPAAAAPAWDAVKALFEGDALGEEARRVLLSGRSADGLVSSGPIVCACFSVGLAAIRAAVAVGRGDERREHRRGVARRHQLRVVPAGAQADRGGCSSPLGIATCIF